MQLIWPPLCLLTSQTNEANQWGELDLRGFSIPPHHSKRDPIVIFCLDYDNYFIHKEEMHIAFACQDDVREYNYSKMEIWKGHVADYICCSGGRLGQVKWWVIAVGRRAGGEHW